jgi:broad specificity phosphatase PhoE
MAGFAMRTPAVAMAAFSHLTNVHPMLPGRCKRGNVDRLVENARRANISKVAFLRHGNTAPSSNGVDFDRQLTDHGRDQAREAGESFGRQMLAPLYPLAMVSPAPRTMETAKIFLESANLQTKICPIQHLYDGTMQPKGSSLFRQLGYAALLEYLNHEDEAFRSDAQLVLGGYAHSFLDSSIDIIEQSPTSTLENSTLLVVGHAIYLPSAALGLAAVAECKDTDLILSCNTKEAEGYLIDIANNNVVSLLKRPSNMN